MAKRISLRAFQKDLVERLANAKRGGVTRSLLGIQAGLEYWLLDLGDAGEILPTPVLTPVPLTRPWFDGIANIRGALYAVVDFSAFQGGEHISPSGDNRLLLVGSRFGINSALRITRALGLRTPEELELQEDRDARPWAGEQYVDKQGRIWRKLLLRNLLSQPAFLEIGI
jgi:twitching motility protein PilI